MTTETQAQSPATGEQAPAVPATGADTPTTPVAQQVSAATVDELQAQLAKVEKALKDANKEAADKRKRLDSFEKAEMERQQAQMSETEKLKTQLAEQQRAVETATARARALELDVMRRDVAGKVGLPAVFASRIQGEDAEAMEADAKALLAAMPQPAQPMQPQRQVPHISPTTPSNAQPAGETDEQRRARLYGVPSDFFNAASARAKGGGVFMSRKVE